MSDSVLDISYESHLFYKEFSEVCTWLWTQKYFYILVSSVAPYCEFQILMQGSFFDGELKDFVTTFMFDFKFIWHLANNWMRRLSAQIPLENLLDFWHMCFQYQQIFIEARGNSFLIELDENIVLTQNVIDFVKV